MPIPRLMNRERPGLVLGTLHKGAAKREGEKMVELPYWRFTSPDPEVAAAFTAIYGDRPVKINVYLPYPTPDENFSFWCEVWGKSGLIHRCDGENAVLWRDGDKMVTGKKPCPGGHRDNDPLKDATGRLYVLIPDLVRAGYVGYVQVQTKSKNDIAHIYKVLTDIYAMRNNTDGLRGILFDLIRVKESISVPGFGQNAGGRQRANKYMIKIQPSAEWMQIQLQADSTRALLPAGGIAASATAPENAPEESDDFFEGEWEGEAGAAGDELKESPAEKPAEKPAEQTTTTGEKKFPVPQAIQWAANVKTKKGNLLGDLITDDLKKARTTALTVKPPTEYSQLIVRATTALISYYEHGEIPAE